MLVLTVNILAKNASPLSRGLGEIRITLKIGITYGDIQEGRYCKNDNICPPPPLSPFFTFFGYPPTPNTPATLCHRVKNENVSKKDQVKKNMSSLRTEITAKCNMLTIKNVVVTSSFVLTHFSLDFKLDFSTVINVF